MEAYKLLELPLGTEFLTSFSLSSSLCLALRPRFEYVLGVALLPCGGVVVVLRESCSAFGLSSFLRLVARGEASAMLSVWLCTEETISPPPGESCTQSLHCDLFAPQLLEALRVSIIYAGQTRWPILY